MDTPARKAIALLSLAGAYIALADGIAMLLPGPSGKLGGATITVLGFAWLAFGFRRLVLSPAASAHGPMLVSRFGLVLLPVLVGPVALGWWVATPQALSWWFAFAWLAVWLGCVALSATLQCPECNETFGRKGWRLELRSDACPHCGASARGGRHEAATQDAESSG